MPNLFTYISYKNGCFVFLWSIQSQNTHDSTKPICKDICLLNQKHTKGVITFDLNSVFLWSIWLQRNQRIFRGKKRQLTRFGMTFELSQSLVYKIKALHKLPMLALLL